MPRCFCNRATSSVRTGESDRLHAVVGDDPCHLARPDEKCLEYAIRVTGAVEDILDHKRGLRNVGRVLEQTGVAEHESGSCESDHLPKRKVPRHDREHRAERAEQSAAVRS